MITKGTTDVSVVFRALSTTTKLGTALTASSPGLSLWYMRDGEAPVTITPTDLPTPQSAHVDNAFIHIGNGWHSLCLPDEASAEGTPNFVLIGGGATGCIIISSKEDFETTVSAVTTTTTTAAGGDGIPNLANLLAAPIFTRTDEGAVRERTVDELIKADAYLKGAAAGDAVPWGLRVAKTKPTGTVIDDYTE